MSKEELMRRIQRLCFAATEAELFLDTHPDCPAALEFYQRTVDELDAATAEYENTWGPIVKTSVNGDSWSWILTPWPWQDNESSLPREGDRKGGRG